mmetsp:Transcript_10503/g.23631  ORF Transcript_10503/g.23631 Transcript_10503/m.23631 type:complete len:332 (+) Transcript_10503:46-1041(+)
MGLELTGTTGLLFGAAGIYASFLYYGSLQEDVFAFQAPDGTTFREAWFLQAIEAGANVVVGFFGMMLSGQTQSLPLKYFAVTGGTQLLAKVCTSLALANGLSFPAATLAKSAKMAPIMLGSLLLGGASYTMREYLQVLAIIAGTVMVSTTDSRPAAPDAPSSLLGVAYICGSLAWDGVTGGFQSRLQEECKSVGVKPKAYDFMFWTNLFMTILAVLVSLATGEAFTGSRFILSNPTIMNKVLLFAACSAAGQSFIFFMISNFGPLKAATVTTTRKIFSVLLSIFLKGHVLLPLGWAGIALGSMGIAGELIPRKGKAEKPPQQTFSTGKRTV